MICILFCCSQLVYCSKFHNANRVRLSYQALCFCWTQSGRYKSWWEKLCHHLSACTLGQQTFLVLWCSSSAVLYRGKLPLQILIHIERPECEGRCTLWDSQMSNFLTWSLLEEYLGEVYKLKPFYDCVQAHNHAISSYQVATALSVVWLVALMALT